MIACAQIFDYSKYITILEGGPHDLVGARRADQIDSRSYKRHMSGKCSSLSRRFRASKANWTETIRSEHQTWEIYRAKTPPLSSFLLSSESQSIFLRPPLNPRTLQIHDPEQAEGKFTLSTHTSLKQSTGTTTSPQMGHSS